MHFHKLISPLFPGFEISKQDVELYVPGPGEFKHKSAVSTGRCAHCTYKGALFEIMNKVNIITVLYTSIIQ